MSWHDSTIWGFDCETSGVDVTRDRIVTACVVKCEPGQEPKAKTWLLNPGIEIPEGATKIHGITTEKAAADGMDAAVGLEQIAQYVIHALANGIPLVAFNANYDLSILDAELGRYDLGGLAARLDGQPMRSVVDPFVLVRGLDELRRNFRKGRKYTLTACCERFGVTLDDAHDAAADAIAAVDLTRQIGIMEDDLAGYGPDALFVLQQTWHRTRQAGYREWLENNGRHDEATRVDGAWPMRLEQVSA